MLLDGLGECRDGLGEQALHRFTSRDEVLLYGAGERRRLVGRPAGPGGARLDDGSQQLFEERDGDPQRTCAGAELRARARIAGVSCVLGQQVRGDALLGLGHDEPGSGQRGGATDCEMAGDELSEHEGRFVSKIRGQRALAGGGGRADD